VDTSLFSQEESAMAKLRKRYTPQFRQQVVELVRAGRSPVELAKQFGPTAQSIRLWAAQADREAGKREGLTSSEREELRKLRQEVQQLKLEREILSKAAAWFAQETTTNSKRSSNS
jgi:transposase